MEFIYYGINIKEVMMSDSQRGKILCLILGTAMFVFQLLVPQPCAAFILISEFLADPAAGILGDANQDGLGSSSQDEFVELYNMGTQGVDLAGWTITDGLKVRHIFNEQAFLPAQSFYVIFGGGQPTEIAGLWDTSSTGSLSLNNSGDRITVYDQGGVLIDMVSYGIKANNNQSLMRLFDGQGDDFFLHAEYGPAEGALFSPGFRYGADQEVPDEPGKNSIPEFPTGIYLLSALLPYIIKRICWPA